MSFREDDDAREERMRALEKELAEARREVSALRPKAARLAAAEKENQRLLADAARAASPAVAEPVPAKRSITEPAHASAASVQPTRSGARASLGPGERSVVIALVVLVVGGVAALVISSQ